MNVKRFLLKWLGAAALSVLVAGCGSVAKQLVFTHPKVESILEKPPIDRTVTHEGHVEYIGDEENRITVLYVSGSPYEMGYEHGRLLGPQVHQTIQDVMKGAQRLLPKALRNSELLSTREKREIINALLDKAWAGLARYTPKEDLEEMAGLSAGSGIPLQVIHRVHAIPDLGETSCSALIARDSATRDGHFYQLRILDYGANFNLQRRPLITVYRPANANAFVNIGWIGFVGVISGMNEKGVALSEIGFGDPPAETLHGMPMPFLLKNVLRYANNAPEGETLVRAAPRTNSYIYFLGDKDRDAIGMITSAQSVLSFRVNGQDTVSFRGKDYPQFQDVIYAGHYQNKQAGLVKEMLGTFDVATVQELARQIAMKSNLQTVIYDLTAEKIWVANRKDNTRASDRPYVEFDLHDAWTKHFDMADDSSPQQSATRAASATENSP